MAKKSERSSKSARGATAQLGMPTNPLDFIAEDHMREREVCALIDRLVAAEQLSSAEIDQMAVFLEVQLPQHLQDEEIDLFPMMLKRCDPDDEIEKVINKLQSDHGHALADAPAIIPLIRTTSISAPEFSDAARRQLTAFASHARRHLILENAIILPIARVRLTDADLAVMRQHMLERRGLSSVSEGL